MPHDLFAHRQRDFATEAALYHPDLATWWYPTRALLIAEAVGGDSVEMEVMDDSFDGLRGAVQKLYTRLCVRAAIRRGMQRGRNKLCHSIL